MTQAELERRLLALERRVPGSTGVFAVPPGVSTIFGVASQHYRDRFPAILTSTFDSTTGYSWARLVLDRTTQTPSLVEVTDPQAGAYAFTPNNSQDLQIGDRGWLEADPNAGGWIFLPDASAGAGVACGELNSGLDTDECLHLYVHAVSGKCSTIDTDQELWLEHDGADSWDATSTLGGPQFDHTGSGTDPADVVFGFTNGVPYLTIDGVYGTPQGCHDGGLLFAFGGATLCAGGTDTDCANYFVVQVKCGCCPIADWDGAGWYCVVGSGEDCGTDDNTCVYLKLSDASACDTDIQICDGPHATEEDCTAACNPTAPCQSINFASGTLTVTYSNQTDCATCIDNTPTISNKGSDTFDIDNGINCEAGVTFRLACSGGQYTWTQLSGNPGVTFALVSFTASPFVAVWDFTFPDGVLGTSPCEGTARVTVSWAA